MADERSSQEVLKIEGWFLSRGLPHFIDDYGQGDVFTRALPGLFFVFVIEVFTALNFNWPWWANVLGVAGALALMITLVVGVNRYRHRGSMTMPTSAGVGELLLFIFGPPLVPLIFGGKGTVSLATIAINAFILVLIYLFTSYGLAPMIRWASSKVLTQLGALVRLLTRALPLLLLFVTFLFIDPDTWQVTSELYGIYFVSSIVFFALIGVVFVVARMPQEIADLNKFDTIDEVHEQAADAGLDQPLMAQGPVDVPLSKRQWGNTSLVVMVSQAIQVLLVGLMVAVFLIVLGMLIIRPSTQDGWIGHPRHVLLQIPYGNEHLEITEQLLRTSVFLAAFSALYFTVVALTDSTYREEFFRDVVSEVRQALAVRVIYVNSLRNKGDS